MKQLDEINFLRPMIVILLVVSHIIYLTCP